MLHAMRSVLCRGFALSGAGAAFVTPTCCHLETSAFVAARVLAMLGDRGRDMALWILEDRPPRARRVVLVHEDAAYSYELDVPAANAPGGVG